MAGEQEFLQKRLRQYYLHSNVSVPEVEAREFGVGEFGKKITRRHITFSSARELNAFLSAFAPFYISYSGALYSLPEKTPMAAKQLFAADLVYEFDADDIKTPCKKKHDSWQCTECSALGKGAIDNCTGCGGKVKVEQWFCPECLGETKKQVFRLLDFLEKDFGFNEGISMNFSGNSGYHVHVRNAAVRELSHDARIELLDYLTAVSLLPESHGFFVQDKRMHCPSPKTSVGWSRRMVSGIMQMVETEQKEELATFGHASLKKVSSLLEKKKEVTDSAIQKNVFPSFLGKKSESFWLSLAEHIVQENALLLDRQTSMDMSKIIRVPNTIHGGTGLVAKTVSLESLPAFDPLSEAVVFSGEETVKVFINKAPKFYLAGEWFGEFEQEQVELPVPVAFFLLARKSAVLS